MVCINVKFDRSLFGVLVTLIDQSNAESKPKTSGGSVESGLGLQPYASHTDSNLGIERTDSCGSAIAREICA